MKLDGSASKPKQTIKDYIWKFRPIAGDCPEGTPTRSTKKEGRKTDIVALCGVDATLTVVAKDGERASASTVVNVVPRGPKGWRTPFKHREKEGDRPRGEPSAQSLGGGHYAFSVDGGLNVSDCAGATWRTQEVLCPLLEGGNSWLGSGYELAKVED